MSSWFEAWRSGVCMVAVTVLVLSTGVPAMAQQPEDGVRGLLQPREQAVLASQVAARIIALPVREGERFEAGDVLVAFDCAFFEADLQAAEADLRAARARLANSEQLLALKSIGDLDVALARAEAAKAAADVRGKQVIVDQCRITAPFGGRVAGLAANAFESVAAGDDVLEILNDRDLEIKVIVPSHWLAWLSEGLPFQFHVDETGETMQAQLIRLGARIDPVSQTLPVFGRLVDASSVVLAGMSGTAVFVVAPPS